MNIRIAGIKRDSLIDGPGICFVIFMQGCLKNCFRCHNPDARPLEGGIEITLDEIYGDIISSKGIDAVVFSGGEPFLQAASLSSLGEKIRKEGLSVITYTGYTFEYLFHESSVNKDYRNLLEVTDILIDGEYYEKERDLTLAFRGSKNQRIIDVNITMQRKGAVVIKNI